MRHAIVSLKVETGWNRGERRRARQSRTSPPRQEYSRECYGHVKTRSGEDQFTQIYVGGRLIPWIAGCELIDPFQSYTRRDVNPRTYKDKSGCRCFHNP